MSKLSRFLIFPVILTTCYLLLAAPTAQARITPADIVNAKRDDFTKAFNSYTAQNQQKIQTIMDAINQSNADSTAILGAIMTYQGNILDEYLSRKKFVETESIKDARYWLTFAHEAIDYQKQRVYIPILTGQANINTDLNNLLASYRSQLSHARGTAVKSLDLITKTVSNLGSQKIATASAAGGGE